MSLVGEPVKLIERDQAWERPLIENPAMVKHNGKYYLFYSGNWWESHQYAIGYAVCETVTGPCEKPLKEPWFKYKAPVMGPGGEAFFTRSGRKPVDGLSCLDGRQGRLLRRRRAHACTSTWSHLKVTGLSPMGPTYTPQLLP